MSGYLSATNFPGCCFAAVSLAETEGVQMTSDRSVGTTRSPRAIVRCTDFEKRSTAHLSSQKGRDSRPLSTAEQSELRGFAEQCIQYVACRNVGSGPA